MLRSTRPTTVILAAAKVGGIQANADTLLDFLEDNLQIQLSVLGAAHRLKIPRLLFLGSSCIYPRLAPKLIREESLLTGPLEPTNDGYAIAKICGIMQVRSVRKQLRLPWISAMLTNLYGPNDNFDPETSHVLPALCRRSHEAKILGAASITVWGTGAPRPASFLHADDLADACLFLLERYDGESPVNVRVGSDLSIAELARLICTVVGFGGELRF